MILFPPSCRRGNVAGFAWQTVRQEMFFPASLAFDKDGSTLYVANLALDLRLFGLAQTGDSQWAAQTRHYTVSKLPAVIPPLP